MSERKMQNHPPGALKSPANPTIPDEIYDMVLDPDKPQASEPIDIPTKNNPLKQSSIFADLAKGARRRDGSSLDRGRKYY
jgi:hypothetical protein